MQLPSAEEVARIFESVKNWGRWGPDDELGALNHLGPVQRARAAATVRDGLSVGLGLPLPVRPSPEVTFPAQHHMIAAGDACGSCGLPPGYQASSDYIGTNVHDFGVTHIDALCHTFKDDLMWNGRPTTDVRSTGALRNDIGKVCDLLVGRGVLLDIPRLHGVDYLEPDTAIRIADLEAAERAQGVEVGTGDLLLVATGRDRRRLALPNGINLRVDGTPGLHPECALWLHEREVAVLGGDGVSDLTPAGRIADWPYPIHQCSIVATGIHLIDNMFLEPARAACAERARWEFLLTVNPIRVPGATGCPVNPVAVF
jgi:kynurenine formamidase